MSLVGELLVFLGEKGRLLIFSLHRCGHEGSLKLISVITNTSKWIPSILFSSKVFPNTWKWWRWPGLSSQPSAADFWTFSTPLYRMVSFAAIHLLFYGFFIYLFILFFKRALEWKHGERRSKKIVIKGMGRKGYRMYKKNGMQKEEWRNESEY